MGAFSDATLQLINQQLQRRNDLLKAFAIKYKKTTWDGIQEQVKTGRASDYWNIGDLLTCNYTATNGTAYEMPWAVAGFRDVYWQNDDVPHPGMILQSVYGTPESVQFDAPEDWVVDSATEPTALEGWYYWGVTGNTYTALNLSEGDTIPFGDYSSVHKCGINNLDVLRYGYNRYRDCGQRQWLESAAPAGEWWQSTHLGDKAPSQLAQINGFQRGLDADFLAVINPVKIQVATNTVTDGGVTDVMYDRFWLPSVEEVYGVPQAAGVEGNYFPYWKEKTGLSAPSNGNNNGRIIYGLENHSAAQYVRLRSASRGSANSAWYVSTTGSLNSNGAATLAYRAAPACVIS